MQNKLSISIDVLKIQKARLRKNSFTTKSGEVVNQTFCDIVAIPLKEKKLIKTGDTYKMYKTGFVVEKGGKEEETNILGDVMEFENSADQSKSQNTTPEAEIDITPEEIPF